MASMRVPKMCGWGNAYLRCQAPLDYLRLTGEVWGRLFYLEVPSEMGAPCTHHRRMIAWTA